MSEFLTPEEIIGASFDTKRKGLDPDAVQRHLAAVARSATLLESKNDELQDEVKRLKADLAAKPEVAVAPAAIELNEDELTERLGQDAARILAEARQTAADRVAQAEREAEDIAAAAEELYAQRSIEADAEAQRIRESAETVVEQRQAEADQSAAQIIADAEGKATTARVELDSQQRSAEADADRLIREAELTRRQILEDLARRRSSARRQIEQLRAGRERLMASHDTLRRALDEISQELTISMSEARAAAETAGHSVSETTIEELEAEIETARLTGLLDTGPVPVVAKTPPDSEPAVVTPASDEPEVAPADNVGTVPPAEPETAADDDDSSGGELLVEESTETAQPDEAPDEQLYVESAEGDSADADSSNVCLLYTSPSPRDRG